MQHVLVVLQAHKLWRSQQVELGEGEVDRGDQRIQEEGADADERRSHQGENRQTLPGTPAWCADPDRSGGRIWLGRCVSGGDCACHG